MKNIARNQYLDRLKKHEGHHIIKVITGIRRCGKSTLLELFKEYLLKERGVKKRHIIAINFEDINNEHLLDYKKLYGYILDRVQEGVLNYIFLDEIQQVAQFQKVVDSLYIKKNIDIYITGSNAYMLSGELATLLSGRYVEISMLPLSFKEYYSVNGGNKHECFTSYLKSTSFPYAATIKDADIVSDYLHGIYNTVLLKDVVQRKKVADVQLLESVVKFLFDNAGNIVSSKRISDTLCLNGRKTTPVTVENYISALCDCYVLYKCGRYDLKGKQYLKSLEKYYLADIGFRHILVGNRGLDVGHILENIIYLELLRRGYTVHIGKVADKEIDFVAQSPKEIVYYQVAQTINTPEIFEREFSPLQKVRDHYKKVVLTMDEIDEVHNGIEKRNIIDFLLEG